MRSLAQKMKKLCPVEFSRKSFKSRKSMKFIKEIFGGQVLKRPAFGLRCADFAQIFFKSHVITKYEKSRCFGVPFLFEKLSNRASKKVWVLRSHFHRKNVSEFSSLILLIFLITSIDSYLNFFDCVNIKIIP